MYKRHLLAGDAGLALAGWALGWILGLRPPLGALWSLDMWDLALLLFAGWALRRILPQPSLLLVRAAGHVPTIWAIIRAAQYTSVGAAALALGALIVGVPSPWGFFVGGATAAAAAWTARGVWVWGSCATLLGRVRPEDVRDWREAGILDE